MEKRYDDGLSYLAEALAARGYVAIAPNLNAVYAAAYGAVSPDLRRYPDVLDAHMQLLIAASRNITTPLGINLQGRLDLSRIGMRPAADVIALLKQMPHDLTRNAGAVNTAIARVG